MKKDTIWQSRQEMQKTDFEVFHYCDRYLKQVRLHHHDFFELYCFLSENVEYTVDGRLFNLKYGDVMLVNPNELHQLSVIEDKPYERIVLWLSKSFLSQQSTPNTDLSQVFVRSSRGNNLIRPSKANSALITAKLERILSANSSTAFGDDVLCNTEIVQLLLLVNSIRSGSVVEIARQRSMIDNILDYINDNLREESMTVQTIADSFFVSQSRLSHLFKQQIGTPLYQYIIKKRLILAKELLQTNKSVKDVYSQCGFKDYLGFFRTFKQEYGITPKQYYYQARVNNET